jgi:hypothetical protein
MGTTGTADGMDSDAGGTRNRRETWLFERGFTSVDDLETFRRQ